MQQESKYEYVNGEDCVMTGGTIPHNAIAPLLFNKSL